MSQGRNWNGPRRDPSWESSGKRYTIHKRHPPGLKGKDIGLFYKNQTRQRGKKIKEFKFTLNIPKTIVTKLKNKLEVIAKLTVHNISKKEVKVENEISSKENAGFELIQPKKELPDNDDNNPKGPLSCKEYRDDCDIFIKPESKGPLSCKEYRDDCDIFIKPESVSVHNDEPSSSKASDFIPIPTESIAKEDKSRILALRGAGDYKYGYEDIITGTFNEKLEECLSNGIKINEKNSEINDLNIALYEDYKVMVNRANYKRLMQFREILPTYKKSKDLLNIIHDNQVVVISGETGCGKSTQIPQLILDDAIINKRGANIKILVTQPRRIAALSLATRVAEERAEKIGSSVGYAVRLEKEDCRKRGSIMYCTTGILLVDLEINQGMTNYSHIILDEVHERDTHIDLAMCMLKEILKQRKDLKLILMSATIDADKLSSYYDNCPMMHIEGLAYPVKDVYLEDILQLTKYQLPVNKKLASRGWYNSKRESKRFKSIDEKEIQHRAEVGPWLESIRHKINGNVYRTLLDSRIEIFEIDLIFELLLHVCKGDPGAILVFLPGIGDITKLIKQMSISGAFPNSRYNIYPLHSKLSSLEQRQIFERPPQHIRKIIIATNIAETSITIDDIVYVIDCGRVKCTGLNVETNISTLQIEWVSQANLRQRRGRAGRCQPGICYHLVTSYRASKLPERFLPELQRSNLLEPVLSIKRLRLGKAADALKLVPDSPASSTVEWAVKHLRQCGALDEEERLTPLGWHLARLPLHPSAGKLLLLAALFGCLDRAASLAAIWSFKDPFLLVIGKEREVEAAKHELALGEPSDHVAMSEAVLRWENLRGRDARDFAYQYFLSINTLELLSDMKRQLGDNLRNMGFLPSGNVKASWENRNADNISLFKAIVAAALYPNIGAVGWVGIRGRNAFKKQIRIKVKTPEDGPVQLHPSSIMCPPPHKMGPIRILCDKPGANWLVYLQKQQSTKLYLLDVTLVYTLPLLFFGELKVIEEGTEELCEMIISTYKVQCVQETADVLFELRKLLDQVLASKIMVNSTHAEHHNEFEDEVIKALVELITAEDEGASYYHDDGDDTAESDTSECNVDRRH
ncbi:ATP-dependent DNA/RNA helicase DHX36-like [Achroia grisella]|uniref:ATP-dependent DNA/RNA helicase DHX36-like n=1 Tax=Achroia grisella TaxID=688607 RepID=UPI0027D2FAEF|nr:ATP-dependent DNA/RNA helicase DHX36-like [Achroia grisella]